MECCGQNMSKEMMEKCCPDTKENTCSCGCNEPEKEEKPTCDCGGNC